MFPLKNKNPTAPRRERITRMERHERFTTSFFLLPSYIGVALFYVAPFLLVFYYALTDNGGDFCGFENFTALFQNYAFRNAAKNTAVFSAIAVPLAVLVPLLLALLLMQKLPFKSIFRTVLISPLMVPVASVVLVWEVLFHNNGVVNQLLEALGGAGIDWFKSDWNQVTIVLLYLWKNIGYNMILFMAALGGIPKGSLEAAALDGASSARTFFAIKLPYLSSTILFVTILSIINSFKVFREVYLLTGAYPYDSLYMLQHFMNNTFTSLNYQKLSCAALVMGLVMIALIGILFWIDGKLGRDIEE